jgi:DnaJ-class molecular chaperone
MKAYPDYNGDRVKTCPDCNGDGVVDKEQTTNVNAQPAVALVSYAMMTTTMKK